MGKRNKRARTILRKASILGEEISPQVARRYGITNLLPKKPNSEKIEELKQNEPEPIVEEPVVLKEPDFEIEEPILKEKKPIKKSISKKTNNKVPRKRTLKTKNKS
jgi:hypothetical protein